MKLTAKLLAVLAILVVIAELSEGHYRRYRRYRRYRGYRRCSRSYHHHRYSYNTPAPTPAPAPVPAAIPVPTIPADVLEFYNSMAALPYLLFFNLFANTLPPTDPLTVDEVALERMLNDPTLVANPYADPYAQPYPTNQYVDPYAQQYPTNQYVDPYAQQYPTNQYVDPYAQQYPTNQYVDPYAQQYPTNQYYDPNAQQYPTNQYYDPNVYNQNGKRSVEEVDGCDARQITANAQDFVNNILGGRLGSQYTLYRMRAFLNNQDECELKKIAAGLDDIGATARKMLEAFLITKDTAEAVSRSVRIEYILAVAKDSYETRRRGKRGSYSYQPSSMSNYQLMFQLRRYGSAILQKYPQLAEQYRNLLQNNPQLSSFLNVPSQTAAATSAPAPATPADTDTVMTSVLSRVGPSLRIREPVSSVLGSMKSTYRLAPRLTSTFGRLIQYTRFRDPEGACYLLRQYASSRRVRYGLRRIATYAYNKFNCAEYFNAKTSDSDSAGTVDAQAVAYGAAVPEQAPSSATAPAPAPVAAQALPPAPTPTTPKPSSACGVSRDLDRLNNAATEDFFITSRIVGGTSSGSCETVPWQVRLTMNGEEMCGGSILDSTHILTAAHCIPASGSIEVKAGDYHAAITESTEQVRTASVSDVTKHPEYHTNVYGGEVHDIAVIKLNEPLDMTRSCIEPVCLDKDFPISGQNCTVSGWGTLEANGDISSTLQYANVRTETGDNCVSAFSVPYKEYISDASNQLCAGFPEGGTDACQGDSGGPLVCRDNEKNTYVQTGIISYGNGCGDANYPGLYTKTSSYHEWIQAQITN